MPGVITCTCMKKGCRTCREREYARRVYRLRAYGQWDPHGDLELVVAHLEHLRTRRVGIKHVADMTGLSRSTVYRIRSGGNKRISKRVAELILAVQPSDTLRVDPLGTSRRIHALMAIGWSTYAIAERIGCTQAQVWEMAKRRHWVTARRAEDIANLYADLCMTPGPSTITRSRAVRAGHVPPLGWDDIDNPDEQPKMVKVSDTADRTAVRAHELEHMAFMGENLETACAALGITANTLNQWCTRTGNSHLYNRLAARQRTCENQHTTRSAVA